MLKSEETTLNLKDMPGSEVLQQLQQILARQSGYRGYIAIEGENGQRVFVRLWDSETSAQAATESDELKAFRATYISPAVTQSESIARGDVLHINMSPDI